MLLSPVDSRPVFARLLDWSRGGHFGIAPIVPYQARRRCLPGTNVLQTRFETIGGRPWSLTHVLRSIGEPYHAAGKWGWVFRPPPQASGDGAYRTTRLVVESHPGAHDQEPQNEQEFGEAADGREVEPNARLKPSR